MPKEVRVETAVFSLASIDEATSLCLKHTVSDVVKAPRQNMVEKCAKHIKRAGSILTRKISVSSFRRSTSLQESTSPSGPASVLQAVDADQPIETDDIYIEIDADEEPGNQSSEAAQQQTSSDAVEKMDVIDENAEQKNYAWVPKTILEVIPLPHSSFGWSLDGQSVSHREVRSVTFDIIGNRDPGRLKDASERHFDRLNNRSTAQSDASTSQQAGPDSVSQQQNSLDGITSIAYLQHYLYVIGPVTDGETTPFVYRTDVSTKDGSEPSYGWEQVTSMPSARPYHASTTTSDAIIVSGGGRSLRALIRFDLTLAFSSNAWEPFTSYGTLIEDRRKHCFVKTSDFCYALGGVNENNEKVSSCEKSSEDLFFTFHKMASMNHARSNFLSIHHELGFYVIGGCGNELQNKATVERYNYSSDQWENLKEFATDTRRFTGFIFDQQLIILGGKPKTLDLRPDPANRDKPAPASRLWNLSPVKKFPTMNLDNTISILAQWKYTTSK